jgi:hypothetical protein
MPSDKRGDADPHAMSAVVASNDDLEKIVGGIPQRHRRARRCRSERHRSKIEDDVKRCGYAREQQPHQDVFAFGHRGT